MSPRAFLGSGTCLPNVCGMAAGECRVFDRAGKLVPTKRCHEGIMKEAGEAKGAPHPRQKRPP